MCRLFAIYGSTLVWKNLLLGFQKQAKTGNVPPNFPPGHEDGWGIAYAFSDDEIIRLAGRSSGSAYRSEKYVNTVQTIGHPPSVILAHLRKASRGVKVSERNSHPFVQKKWAFMHNGTFYDFEKLPRDPDLDLTSENSDTEYLFHFMLSTFIKKQSFHVAWKQFVDNLEKNQHRFSAVNCIFSNGKVMYAIRWAKELPEYYTLYHYRSDENFCIIASEPLEDLLLQKDRWVSIPNESIIKISKQDPNIQVLDKDGKAIRLEQ
ncbi:MAG: class II glutamine amidotransferase [Candidatus Hodarchaeales archaeon]